MATEYKLGAQDKIKIRVLEWLASKGSYQLWEGIDGEYPVSVGGMLSIPLIGPVQASGLTAEEVAGAIALAVQVKTELQHPPEVSVQIAQYRPVYIVGEVKTPGEYAWRPGLDVIKAIGLAGGRYRPFESSSRLERDVISQTGILQALQLEIVRTQARQARFAAEASQEADIVFPPSIMADPTNSQVLREERAILTARRGALARQLAAIDALKSFLTTEIESLQAKVAVQERQLASAQKELSSVAGLASRGLSPANRQFAMDRVLASIETDRLDLSTAIIRVRQNLANADRDKIALVEERQLEIARNQQDAQASLEQLYARQHTAERLVFEAGVLAPTSEAEAARRLTIDIAYSIARRVDGAEIRIAADRDTLVEPDDVIEIIALAPRAGLTSGATAGAPFSDRDARITGAEPQQDPAGDPAQDPRIPVPSPVPGAS